ncbi:type I polyketide synthase [Actinokineospora iranica]|uniref:Myxalamid-type polyketide synthase MxaB n=1 Tax=Actinokineospora iranica TaxID=1271860 RepID=A0A1G6PJ46_9PSEU|nr:type I polyketide synthase [Actinokineospora iranica]SDC79437.1 myxalamid-type polyketide synthase MxaB [Actinokineospora iranica]
MTGNTTASRTDALTRQLLAEKYEPIAIVGMGVHFPGDNDDPGKFADFLRAGGDGTGPVPTDRWDMAALQAAERAAGKPPLAAGGGFVSGMDLFDPRFFNISPKEAGFVDPQHRWALECSWRAFESANIDPATLRHGNGGVYLGVGQMDFTIEVESVPDGELDAHIAAGTAHSAAAGRLSYFLGWRGPCLSVDTACSSSLVALHLAVQGLRKGECEIALAGGVNGTHHPRNHIVYSRARMLSPDGKCKTFDDSADGYGRSEGCGMLLLKRLSDARRDGDTVLALVRGSAVRQDGESGGLTVPNGTAQAALMRAALASARLKPAEIGYVEAHGTGTSLGDPIEMSAIDTVFSSSRAADDPLVVGSVKTNIGHMEAAAGVGGIVKTVLQMREGVIYPHINLTTPSRHIPWDRYRVTVPTDVRDWAADGPRRAMVNSYGFAGTIASVVLEEAPRPKTAAEPTDTADTGVLTISAKTHSALPAQLRRYRRFLDDNPDISIADLCHTANVGRTHLAARIAGPVDTRADALRLLDEALSAPPTDSEPSLSNVAFMFAGQGSQYPGMGKALYDRYPVFRAHVDDCDRLFAAHLGMSVRDMMFDLSSDDADDIHQTQLTQPALFTLEYALARLWMDWGVRPTVLLGHSIGEIVAATVAGLFTVEDAVTLVAARARLMQAVSAPGGMIAVRAAAADVAPLLADFPDVGLGGINAPEQCVISGGHDSLAAIVATLTERGVKTKALSVSHAFHSPLMAEVFDAFRDALRDIAFHEPRLSFVSNVTGAVAAFAEVGTAEYWVRHIAEPVNFAAGMRAVQERGAHVFVEVGPAATLNNMGRQNTDPAAHLWVSSLDPADEGTSTIRRAVARCYTAGLPIDWARYHSGRPGRRVPAPGYVFDRKRYWLPALPGAASGAASHHPLLGTEISAAAEAADGRRVFRTRLSPLAPGYLADHVVMGQVVFPGAGYVETILAAQDAVFGETARPLRDIRILEPLFLAQDALTEVETRLRPLGDGEFAAEIVSRVEGQDGAIERLHATAVIGGPPQPTAATAEVVARLRAERDRGQARATVSADDLYARYTDLGLPYGTRFRLVREVSRFAETFAVGDLRAAAHSAVEQLTAAVLDCAMQTIGGIVDLSDAYLPVAFATIELFKKPKGDLEVLTEITAHDDDGLTADIVGMEGDRAVFAVRGARLKRVARPNASSGRAFLEPRWVKRSLVERASTGPATVVVAHRPQADFDAVAPVLAKAGVELRFAADGREAARMVSAAVSDAELWWFWRASPDLDGVDRLDAECAANYRDLLDLMAGLDGASVGRSVRLRLITEGAQALPGDPPARAEHQAAASLWGAGHVLLTEYPALRATLVDLAQGDLRALADELLHGDAGDGEFQLAYRGGIRHVRRLAPLAAPAEGDFELRITEYGDFTKVKPVPVPADGVEPVGDEVTIAVHAAGLNFKDVLNALGLLRQYALDNGLPEQDLPLGFEAAGTVVAAGPAARFQPGDEVMFSRVGCMRSRVTVPSSVVVAKPSTVDFERAAAIPAAYVTAYHALRDLARVKPGDRVLIHAAAGGVGQAAVRLAQLAGAEVFATASPRKWDLLRGQGVRWVMNSRSLDFADEILAATDGSGVDVVLNSLANEHVAASVRCLAQGGRFVELGKIGIWSPERMARQRPDAEYHNFDLSEFAPDELDRLTGGILDTVAGLLAAGDIEAPPTVAYGLDEIDEAFGVLSRGANIGKLVLRLREDRPAAAPARISPDETYLITGGLGALGTVTAGRLVAEGARKLALMSRREVSAADVQTLTEAIGADVEITVHQGDVADADDIARITAAANPPDAPLGGVIHAAGTLADAPFERQTWDSFDTVLRAKVRGSWLLHKAIEDIPSVRFFVGYSSISSVLGAAGQANYAAGNAYLDALMRLRAAAGLPGLSVNWGPWAEVGMAAELSAKQIESTEDRGIKFIKPNEASRALVRALGAGAPQVVVGEFDWSGYTAGLAVADALFSRLSDQGTQREDDFDVAALDSLTDTERAGAIRDALRGRVARVLRFGSAQDVGADARFVELGLDSLAAVELKNALESLFRIALPTSALFDHPTVRALAEFVHKSLFAEETSADPSHEAAADEVRNLTESEVDAELAALRALNL